MKENFSQSMSHFWQQFKTSILFSHYSGIGLEPLYQITHLFQSLYRFIHKIFEARDTNILTTRKKTTCLYTHPS